MSCNRFLYKIGIYVLGFIRVKCEFNTPPKQDLVLLVLAESTGKCFYHW